MMPRSNCSPNHSLIPSSRHVSLIDLILVIVIATSCCTSEAFATRSSGISHQPTTSTASFIDKHIRSLGRGGGTRSHDSRSKSKFTSSRAVPSSKEDSRTSTALWLDTSTSSSLSPTSATSTVSETNERRATTAVVVGGGPVGLAAALALSRPPLSMNVQVLEQAPTDASVKKYDPTKAYLYLINQRGLEWMKTLAPPSALEKLRTRGTLQSMRNLAIIPADPNEPVPKVMEDAVQRLAGQKGAVGVDYDDAATTGTEVPTNATAAAEPPASESYWIPRHLMVQLLEECIAEQEEKRIQGNTGYGSIEMINGKQCVALKHPSTTESDEDDDERIQVVVQDTNNPQFPYEHAYVADFVVGADGMNSAVRDLLGTSVTDTPVSYLAQKGNERPIVTPWWHLSPNKFRVKKWNSPASGLRMKVLQIPTNFTIPDSDGSLVPTDSERLYAFRSVNKGPFDSINLGLLPVKADLPVRTANVITPPSHNVWKFKTGAECKEYFVKAFPRLDWETLIPNDSEWDRFVAAKGTTFPSCQYCTNLAVSHPGVEGRTGIALVGDAIHAFPPDIGQGINAGFVDVLSLHRALCGQDIRTGESESSSSDALPTLGAALKEYERVRGPEVQALIRLARFGSPYQYNQPLQKDRLGKKLWAFNIALRLLLNKFSFGLIPKAALLEAFGTKYTFRQIMRRADLTTVGLWTVLAMVLSRGKVATVPIRWCLRLIPSVLGTLL